MNTSTSPIWVARLGDTVRWLDGWLKFWWYKVPEPRYVSMATGFAYLLLFLTGLATLVYPPQTIEAAVGEVAMALVGWFLVLGAGIGISAGVTDFWQLERVGIVAMGIGIATYAFIIAKLHVTSEGSRLTQLGMISVVLVFLALRMGMIWRWPFKPRR